ncbi:MAG: glycosyltransferase family 4 protein [Flavobacteriales bacterium]|nr:glycosyltransferase family 4 protein [Flavobacteriales bacterium]
MEALSPFASNYVLHVQVHGYGMEKERFKTESSRHIIRGYRRLPWKVIEILNFLVLRRQLKKLDARKQFDVVNFHIAYPMLIHFKRFRHLLPERMLITEHWSYYHFNFHTKEPPARIKQIFDHNIPIIAVSSQLNRDIIDFCGHPNRSCVIPNVVDDAFHFSSAVEQSNYIVMGSFWKDPKKPQLAIEAFLAYREQHPGYRLRVFGEGPMLKELKVQYPHEAIIWEGTLNPGEIADLMRGARAFLMPSGYETFSVVTAEALCCGCPVLVSRAGALPEHITEHNGMVCRDHRWTDKLAQMLDRTWDRERIARDARAKYSKRVVGKDYFDFINQV